MALPVVLAVLEGRDSDAQTLPACLQMARRVGRHVRALHVRADIGEAMLRAADGLTPASDLYAALQRNIDDTAGRASSVFLSWRGEHDLPLASEPGAAALTVEWRERHAPFDEAIATEGRLADLIVIGGRPYAGDARTTELFEAALFETGRPVLLVPVNPSGEIADCAMVSWKNAREAARATAAALPILQSAGRVEVFSCGENGATAAEAQPVVDYLAWHGIVARPHEAQLRKSVGATLLAAAGRAKATMLVLGGYGHSRWRELVLGGVTRHVLANAEIPVLMTH
jgi:nucleotide-binding universal stress UspA family protein